MQPTYRSHLYNNNNHRLSSHLAEEEEVHQLVGDLLAVNLWGTTSRRTPCQWRWRPSRRSTPRRNPTTGDSTSCTTGQQW